MSITDRERYKAIARFQRPGDLFIIELIWPETLEKWVEQGASKQILPTKFDLVDNPGFRDYFKIGNKRIISEVRSSWAASRIDDIGYGVTSMGGSPLLPDFETRIITEDERTITYVNGNGQTLKAIKNKPYSMPMYVDWPVKDRASWNEHKKRLDPDTPGRFPDDWEACVKELNSQDDPVVLQAGGFYHYLREWVGSENLLYMFHDDPNLIDDIMEHMLYLNLEIIKRVLKDVKVDEVDFSEDIAYRAGPLISPDMVRKFMVPRYKKITELCRSHGVDIIFLDSDGNVEQLIPLWIESGINLVWPLEQAAGNDPVALRKKYGKNLILSGGIDKRAVIKGKEAIKEEVMAKVPFLLEQGGYFPSVDHLVPPNVTFDNYCYYINLLREVAGMEKLSF